MTPQACFGKNLSGKHVPQVAPNMPPSYGHWIAGICTAVFLYRASKAAFLFRFGQQSVPKIIDRYNGLQLSKFTYSFKNQQSTFHGTWQTFPQYRELSIAYWEPYPRFHIAYWNYSTVD